MLWIALSWVSVKHYTEAEFGYSEVQMNKGVFKQNCGVTSSKRELLINFIFIIESSESDLSGLSLEGLVRSNTTFFYKI